MDDKIYNVLNDILEVVKSLDNRIQELEINSDGFRQSEHVYIGEIYNKIHDMARASEQRKRALNAYLN